MKHMTWSDAAAACARSGGFKWAVVVVFALSAFGVHYFIPTAGLPFP